MKFSLPVAVLFAVTSFLGMAQAQEEFRELEVGGFSLNKKNPYPFCPEAFYGLEIFEKNIVREKGRTKSATCVYGNSHAVSTVSLSFYPKRKGPFRHYADAMTNMVDGFYTLDMPYEVRKEATETCKKQIDFVTEAKRYSLATIETPEKNPVKP